MCFSLYKKKDEKCKQNWMDFVVFVLTVFAPSGDSNHT